MSELSTHQSTWRLRMQAMLDSRTASWISTTLILFSVVSFCVETIPDLTETSRAFLYWSEIVVVFLFTIEYVLRIVAADKPTRFIFSLYGLIDLAAILPFYLATAIDLRSLRLIRMMRIVRLLKLARYNQAMVRFANALFIAKEELLLFGFASLIILFLAAVGIYHFEHAAQPEVFRSIFDCLWWAVASLTTVGYGDIYPITIGGRFFTFLVLAVGLGLVAVPTGIIASAMAAVRERPDS